jgi:hypothetical protein
MGLVRVVVFQTSAFFDDCHPLACVAFAGLRLAATRKPLFDALLSFGFADVTNTRLTQIAHARPRNGWHELILSAAAVTCCFTALRL